MANPQQKTYLVTMQAIGLENRLIEKTHQVHADTHRDAIEAVKKKMIEMGAVPDPLYKWEPIHVHELAAVS